MADEDLRRVLRRALDARTVLVLLAGLVDRTEDASERPAYQVLRQLGLVFGPHGLHHAGRLIRLLDREPDAGPELEQDRPGFLGRHVDGEPALAAIALNLGERTGRRDRGRHCARRCASRRTGTSGGCGRSGDRLRPLRHRETFVTRQLRKIRRNFQRHGARARRLVVDLVVEHTAGPAAACHQRGACQQNRGD